LDIYFGTPLLRLAHIVLLLRLQLSLAIARDARNSTADSARNTVCDAGAEIVQLALGLLAFSLRVLAVAFLLQALLFTVSFAL
jgi:hypothetical protein